jgi:ATP/ADP translocase
MALMFVPSAGAAIGIASAESLLLSRVGADALPRLYIILGLVTIFTTMSITALLGRVSPARFYLFLPVLLAALVTAARFLVGLDLVWIYGTLWVAVFLFDTLLSLMLWGLAGMAFDTRQAKRLFPLLGAAGILGLALGGLVTRPLVALLGTENLLFVWVLTLLIAFGLAYMLTVRIAGTRAVTAVRSGSSRRSRVSDDLQAGLHYVRRSRLLRWVAVAAILFYVLFFLLAFPFSKAVEQQYPTEDAMTGFLGVFRGLTTGVALLISLLAATRFYARFGLIAGVLALALLDLAGFSVLAVSTSFAAIVGVPLHPRDLAGRRDAHRLVRPL